MNDRPSSLPMPVVPGLSGLSILARGGYATVYRAMQQSVGREVAVKAENRALESDRDQRRFLREAQAAGRMSSHPHVVDLFDAGVTVDQQPYLIMELCDGSYADRMRTAPLSAAEARDLGVKIADALAHAHQSGVLHRDVKPANILYSRFNSAVLADFGLAVLAEVRDSSVTLEVLTPAYAAPEMFRHSTPSPAVDIYALCATLYAVLHGKPPRWREDRNPSLITLMEMFSEPIPDIPGVPGPLLDVLRAGMANDPAARPGAEHLRDLLDGLRLHRGGGPVGPTGGSAVGGVGGDGSGASGAAGSGASAGGDPRRLPGGHDPATPRDPASTDPPPGRRRRRLGWLFGGLGALALGAAAGGAAWMVDRDGEPSPAPTIEAQVTLSPTPPGPTANPGQGGALAGGDRVGALPGCLVALPGTGRCPDSPECYGPLSGEGPLVAEPVDCARRHTWETYAIWDLPVGMLPDDLAAMAASALVRKVCNEGTFRAVSWRLDQGWRLEVLPPSEAALKSGDRSYRCLAGKGPGELLGPTLTR